MGALFFSARSESSDSFAQHSASRVETCSAARTALAVPARGRGRWGAVRRRSGRRGGGPALLLRTPPHCLKKNGTPAARQLVADAQRPSPFPAAGRRCRSRRRRSPSGCRPGRRRPDLPAAARSTGSGPRPASPAQMLDPRQAVLPVFDADAPPDVRQSAGVSAAGSAAASRPAAPSAWSAPDRCASWPAASRAATDGTYSSGTSL